MDRFYLTFENTDTTITKSGISIPVDYSFWPKVMKYFTDRSTSFLVECWEDEKDAIRSASSYGEKKEDIASKLLTFEGRLTEEFIHELINEPFDQEGKIKWKEVLAIVISLLETVLRDFIANSKISPKML